ncbi:MAG: VOC family protein [Candidatus Eremiobacteraeota bacterium]|nr:VOC family protein [Candidatus Eremiobacteraeota bacterium]MBV8354401.1 VOC family protein [Candidatus Eremiobacteraeota bacterium]
MGVTRLDHVNISTPRCEETKDFFVDVVGLEVGDRPPFAFPGYWLYSGDQAVIHLGGMRDESGSKHGGAAIDHISFRMTGLRAMREKLEQRKIPHEVRVVPRTGDVQIFVADPNGVSVELTYAAAEAAAEKKTAAL